MLLKTLLEIVAETGSSTKFEEVVRIGSPALNHVGLLLSPQQPPPPPGMAMFTSALCDTFSPHRFCRGWGCP